MEDLVGIRCNSNGSVAELSSDLMLLSQQQEEKECEQDIKFEDLEVDREEKDREKLEADATQVFLVSSKIRSRLLNVVSSIAFLVGDTQGAIR